MVSENQAKPSLMGIILVSDSVMRSPSTPSPLEVTITPWEASWMARISTHRVSPGRAPFTSMGPTEQSMMEMSMSGRRTEASRIWPL